MSAPTGNSNATKWTESHTLFTLDRIEKYAMMDHVHTLSRALVKAHIYKGIWTYWKHRWSKHEEIMDKICYIEQVFIMKIEEGGLSKRWHAGMCLLMLRVNYGQGEVNKRPKRRDEELPPHLLTAYNENITADIRLERENEEKRKLEEKDKVAKIRAAKKAEKLKSQAEITAIANDLPTNFSVCKNGSVDEHDDAVQVVDINRGREDTVVCERDVVNAVTEQKDYQV